MCNINIDIYDEFELQITVNNKDIVDDIQDLSSSTRDCNM